MTVPSTDPRAAQRKSLRRAVLHLALGVAVVHSLAYVFYELADVEQMASRPRMIFTVVWMVATGVTVAVLLRRVREVRFGKRRGK